MTFLAEKHPTIQRNILTKLSLCHLLKYTCHRILSKTCIILNVTYIEKASLNKNCLGVNYEKRILNYIALASASSLI